MRKKLMVFLVVAFTIAPGILLTSCAPSLPVSTYYRSSAWLAANPISIAVHGDIPNLQIPGCKMNLVAAEDLFDAEATDRDSAIWMDGAKLSEALNGDTYLDAARRFIVEGKVVLFYGGVSNAKVREFFRETPVEIEIDPARSNVQLAGVYVWCDTYGKIQFGAVVVEDGASESLIWESLLEATVNHLNRYNTCTETQLIAVDGNSRPYATPAVVHTDWQQTMLYEQQYTFVSTDGSRADEWLQISVSWNQRKSWNDPNYYDNIGVTSVAQSAPAAGYGTDYAVVRYEEDEPGWVVEACGPQYLSPRMTEVAWQMAAASTDEGSSSLSMTPYGVSDLHITYDGDMTKHGSIKYDYNHTTDYAKQTTRQTSGIIWARPTTPTLYVPLSRVVQWKRPYSFARPHFITCAWRIGPFQRP